jgi:hypothetical protein
MLDIVERAAAALPRLAALALAPGAALANHSCLPNCQVESSNASDADADAAAAGGGAGCGGLRVMLVALRDIAPGEELTVSYVPVTQPLEARRSELAARHGFRCECARCAIEEHAILLQQQQQQQQQRGTGSGSPSTSGGGSSLPPQLTASELRCLADQAQEEARYEDAERAAGAALALDPADGDAAHKAGWLYSCRMQSTHKA